MTEFVELNHVDFELKHTDLATIIHYIDEAQDNRFHRDLSECYERPSQTKRDIYDDWFSWVYDFNAKAKTDMYITWFRITSYNIFQFTLKAVMYVDAEPWALLEITKEHNRFYRADKER